MRTRGRKRLVIEHREDEGVRPYIEQLMHGQNCSQDQTPNGQSNEVHNSTGTEVQQNDESVNSDARKVRGPTLLKEIWKMPPGKTVSVQFNSRNQAIGKEGRKLASFLGIVARTPELTQLHVDDWRSFDKEEKKKLVEFVRAENGIEPTRALIFMLTHKQRKDGRPLDDQSTMIIDMMNEKLMSNSERSDDEPPRSVAWEGDVYSQVLGNEKSGYVRGLGLRPTPSVLWGGNSSSGNTIAEDSSNKVKRLEEEITKLKEIDSRMVEQRNRWEFILSYSGGRVVTMDPSVVCLPIREEEWPPQANRLGVICLAIREEEWLLRIHELDVVLPSYSGGRISIEGDHPDVLLLVNNPVATEVNVEADHDNGNQAPPPALPVLVAPVQGERISLGIYSESGSQAIREEEWSPKDNSLGVICLAIQEEEWPSRVYDLDVVLPSYSRGRIAIEGDHLNMKSIWTLRVHHGGTDHNKTLTYCISD
ncbi:hypothetical protein RND71_034472 [Anisodus tanguticus]|uniref:Uncharacterized protein n=1 Tax=Anisodus tanguticus TaxID=243964 RepID=A0AAE1RAT3_9SOLA|nr:hypothetical protein RND71_034472 [Anisodus tanguticus]